MPRIVPLLRQRLAQLLDGPCATELLWALSEALLPAPVTRRNRQPTPRRHRSSPPISPRLTTILAQLAGSGTGTPLPTSSERMVMTMRSTRAGSMSASGLWIRSE